MLYKITWRPIKLSNFRVTYFYLYFPKTLWSFIRFQLGFKIPKTFLFPNHTGKIIVREKLYNTRTLLTSLTQFFFLCSIIHLKARIDEIDEHYDSRGGRRTEDGFAQQERF